jgi:hypothetical protein
VWQDFVAIPYIDNCNYPGHFKLCRLAFKLLYLHRSCHPTTAGRGKTYKENRICGGPVYFLSTQLENPHKAKQNTIHKNNPYCCR